jgi:hypothetical protein
MKDLISNGYFCQIRDDRELLARIRRFKFFSKMAFGECGRVWRVPQMATFWQMRVWRVFKIFLASLANLANLRNIHKLAHFMYKTLI